MISGIMRYFAQHHYIQFPVYFLGGIVVVLALASYLTDERMVGLFVSLQRLFGWGYTVIYLSLLSLSIYAWSRLVDSGHRLYWLEVGQQAAGGVATLSLTFTLLGISLGIGSLSDKTITPESIQGVIQVLTGHFSIAFMTTVVGLPTANILRSAIAVRHVRLQELER